MTEEKLRDKYTGLSNQDRGYMLAIVLGIDIRKNNFKLLLSLLLTVYEVLYMAFALQF